MKSTSCYTNHPGMIDYKRNSYFFYHTADLPGGGSYHRSIAVEQFAYNDDGSIPEIEPTKEGPDAIDTLIPYNKVEAETIAKSEGVKVDYCVYCGMRVTKYHDGEYIRFCYGYR